MSALPWELLNRHCEKKTKSLKTCGRREYNIMKIVRLRTFWLMLNYCPFSEGQSVMIYSIDGWQASYVKLESFIDFPMRYPSKGHCYFCSANSEVFWYPVKVWFRSHRGRVPFRIPSNSRGLQKTPNTRRRFA